MKFLNLTLYTINGIACVSRTVKTFQCLVHTAKKKINKYSRKTIPHKNANYVTRV